MNENWTFNAYTKTVRDHRNHCLFSAKTFGQGGTFDAARLPDAEKILRLAAAAPALLKALEEVVALSDRKHQAWDNARAAIAAAKGVQP